MARLFPLRSETPRGDTQPRVVDLEGEDADAVFSALSSTTAREIYAALSEQPRTPSDVAEAIDSSIQNVRYHLENLEEAGLIEVVDTWYSSRGNEMSVYATVNGPLIVASDRSRAERLKAALSRYLGGVVALAGASLSVQYGLDRFVAPENDAADAGSPDGEDGGGANDAAGANGGDLSNDSANGADDDADDGSGETDDSTGDGFEGIDDSTGNDSDSDPGGDDGSNDSGTGDLDAEADGGSTDGGSGDAVDPGAADGVDATDGAAELAEAAFATVPPGLLFFLGGLVVLTAVTAYWYWRTY